MATWYVGNAMSEHRHSDLACQKCNAGTKQKKARDKHVPGQKSNLSNLLSRK
jgi:hypothetical protein